MEGVVKTTAVAEARPMEVHVTETGTMPTEGGGDGGGAAKGRHVRRRRGRRPMHGVTKAKTE